MIQKWEINNSYCDICYTSLAEKLRGVDSVETNMASVEPVRSSIKQSVGSNLGLTFS